MKANNAITVTPKQSFSQMLTAENMKKMLLGALGSPQRASSFTSTLISVQSSSEALMRCDPKTIISAALRGEGMNLSLVLGQYGIVPYGDQAHFQIQYKGLAQLAIRTNEYIDFDVFDVRDGEYKGRDPKTRQPIIEWIENEAERDETPLAGFYGFYQLKSGFFKSMYWTHEKILKHADRYSKAFSLETYNQLLSGELDATQAAKMRSGSPWYDDPLSEAHQKMCKKTVLIQLLGDGKAPLSIELRDAMDRDVQEDLDGAPVIVPGEDFPIPLDHTLTAEASAHVDQQEPENTPAPSSDGEEEPKTKSRSKKAAEPAPVDESAAVDSFFDTIPGGAE